MSEDKIDIKDIHNTLWRCRDFELANLWQRSIFLTAFLVLCFTAYGTVLIKLFDDLCDTKFIVANLVAYVLTLIGLIFSIFWIKMGKGSKAWYEKYEAAILAFERNKKYTNDDIRKIAGFNYKKLENYQSFEIDNDIFSTKAGAYSVSKINIAIGQVFCVLWISVALVHLTITSVYIRCIDNQNIISITVFGVGFIGLTISYLIFSSPKFMKSTHI